MDQRNSLTSFLDDALTRSGEIAFVQRHGLRQERWTYGELARTAYQFARELAARGVGSGDRVLLWGSNQGAWVAAWFGCLTAGAVAVPLDELAAPDFVERVQQQVQAKFAVASEKLLTALPGTVPSCAFENFRVFVSHNEACSIGNHNAPPHELAQIIFTSGTTAEPKGVCLTHRNLLSNLAPLEMGIAEYRRWEKPFHPIRFLCLLPLSHVFGQFMGIFIPFLLGGEVHMLDTNKPAEIIGAIKRERISVAALVPRQLELMREKLEREQTNFVAFQAHLAEMEGRHPLLRWWRFRQIHSAFGWKFWAFVVGGATLPLETEQFWQRLGYAVIQGYGMTETASLVSVNHPFKASRGSIGKTLPGQELKLDADGTILVRGSNVAAGYWQAGATHPVAENAGWLRTGDIGALDENGNLFFKGRAKDVIVTASGLNIFPADLEAALNAQPEIKGSCVLGVEGATGPEALAVLRLRSTNTANTAIDAALKRANATLNSAQQIRRWLIWPKADFPRTATQKVRKPLVRQWVEQQLTGATLPDAARKADTLFSVLAESCGAASATFQAAPDATLDSLGLDSLGRVSLISKLEAIFQTEISEADITGQTTLQELETMLARREHGTTFMSAATGQESAVATRAQPFPYPSWSLGVAVRFVRLVFYYLLILPITRLLCWPRVIGVERLNDCEAPALFVSNHITMIDHGLILAALPWRWRNRLAIAMDGERLRSWRYPDANLNWLLRGWLRVQYLIVVTLFNVFPLPRLAGFRQSFAYAGAAMDKGYSVLVFPEGRITDDGEIHQFMPGIGALANQLSAPIVPLRINGLFELKQSRRWRAKSGSVSINIGMPLWPASERKNGELSVQLESAVRKLF